MEKLSRWTLLDRLLSQGVPLAQTDIFKAYQDSPEVRLIKPSFFEKYDEEKKLERLHGTYIQSFRKDMDIFKSALRKNGMSDALVVGRGAKAKLCDDGMDGRTKTYMYRDKGFSVLPYLTKDMTDGEYKGLLRAISKLRSVLNEQTFEEVQFAIQTRIEADYLKGVLCVDYEDNKRLKGRNLRPMLYKAIREKQILEITHEKFNGERFTFEYHPYLLKQYNERWFLLCYFPKMDYAYFNIALDRIVGMPVVKGHYEENMPEGYMDFFKEIIGVTRYKDVEIVDVFIGVTEINAWGRITTKPLNTMQIVEPFDREKSYGRVKLHIAPNIEFYMKILSLGENIVIESDPERETMKSILSNILREYA